MVAEMVLTAYSRPLVAVPSFEYLGWAMLAFDNDWLAFYAHKKGAWGESCDHSFLFAPKLNNTRESHKNWRWEKFRIDAHRH